MTPQRLPPITNDNDKNGNSIRRGSEKNGEGDWRFVVAEGRREDQVVLGGHVGEALASAGRLRAAQLRPQEPALQVVRSLLRS